MKTSRLALILAAALWPWFAVGAVKSVEPAAWRAAVEQEWLLEAGVQAEAVRAGPVTPEDDASGGCDGVTNGRWGFHTAIESHPWWQVDLGQNQPVTQVRIWNRADEESSAQRASEFRILLSGDGSNWREAYRHNGRVFYGYRMPDRSPLVVKLSAAEARFVRIQLPGVTCLHLDEVEVIGKNGANVAHRRPALQSSISEWSVAHMRNGGDPDWRQLAIRSLENCERLAASASLPVGPDRSSKKRGSAGGRESLTERQVHSQIVTLKKALNGLAPTGSARPLFLQARALQRRLTLAGSLIDFDAILFTKRVPGSYSHMSDQYYGWWSRPGGGIHILRGFKTDSPSTECLTDAGFKQPGSFLRPALSYDGRKVLFAWCRYYPDLAREKDKLNKANVPEDAFYHVFEMNLDGSGLRRLTQGKYDNFDARYLPGGRIVFLSTRRGQAVQVGKSSAAATIAQADLPDCYVRCGGDASRPVAVYTLHTMNADGGDLTPISPFEMFEWEPSVAGDGTILYSRWDYVDRDNMPYMSLWSINPDGTNARLVYGNYTQDPHCTFEPRQIPGSPKIIFTASGHHSQTMGSLVLLDPAAGTEGKAPITRLTPETVFPEIEGWPRAFYASPWPLSEQTHLVSWGVEDQVREGRARPANGMGLHLLNAGIGLELLYRDPEISSMYPIPLKPAVEPPLLSSGVKWDGPQEGRFLISDVSRGLKTVRKGEIKSLRIVAIPAKTQPWMNQPVLGLTRDDPGKAVLGTVPVEEDGSAYFRVPSGVALFFQALDAEGRAVQTMRSATHVQPGQTLSCVGCHDTRQNTPPPSNPPIAGLREPSRITVGPEGSWTMRFDQLIQPVLDAQCVQCHNPKSTDARAAALDLTPSRAYQSLTTTGQPSVQELVLQAYRDGVSTERQNPALRSGLLQILMKPEGHRGVKLDRAGLDRFVVWLDTYAQKAGAFSPAQEAELIRLRQAWTDLLVEPVPDKAASAIRTPSKSSTENPY